VALVVFTWRSARILFLFTQCLIFITKKKLFSLGWLSKEEYCPAVFFCQHHFTAFSFMPGKIWHVFKKMLFFLIVVSQGVSVGGDFPSSHFPCTSCPYLLSLVDDPLLYHWFPAAH
jgi:hypothetical protein